MITYLDFTLSKLFLQDSIDEEFNYNFINISYPLNYGRYNIIQFKKGGSKALLFDFLRVFEPEKSDEIKISKADTQIKVQDY